MAGTTVIAYASPTNILTSPDLDAAAILSAVPVSFDIPGVGIPTGQISPRNGMTVVKQGSATGLTRGTIATAPNTAGRAKNGFEIRPSGSVFAGPGDSGSLVIEPSSRKVVGLLYGAVDAGGSRGWGAAIDATYVSSRLGISFAGRPGIFINPGMKGLPNTCNTTPSGTGLICKCSSTNAANRIKDDKAFQMAKGSTCSDCETRCRTGVRSIGGAGAGPSAVPTQIDNPIAALIQAIIDFINDFISGWNEDQVLRRAET